MNAEPFDLSVEKRDSYIYARVEGEIVPPRVCLKYLPAIAVHCREYNCQAILIEKQTPELFDVWDTAVVAGAFVYLGHDHIKIAVVEKGGPLPEQTKLEVVVGRQFAFDVRLFTDLTDAERWLLDNDGKDHTAIH